MEDLTVCGYKFPNTHAARVTIIAVIEEMKARGWTTGIKQEDFLMFGMKGGYTYQTIRMGGTRQYFCPVEDPTSPDAALTTYGIFFTRRKVGRAYSWYAIPENCEEALKHKDKIMSEANEGKQKTIDNKVNSVLTNLKQLKYFTKGAVIAPRPMKYSSRVKIFSVDELHRSAAAMQCPAVGYLEEHCSMLRSDQALIIGEPVTALTKFSELYHICQSVGRKEYMKILDSFREHVIDIHIEGNMGPDDYVNIAAFGYFKVAFPQIMVLGTSKMGYIDPTSFKIVARSNDS